MGFVVSEVGPRYSMRMFDLFYRAFLSPIDYASALFRRTLIFKERIAEGEDVYSFIFTPTKHLSWKAGQHGLFLLPGKKVTGKVWRAFSIASTPEEGVVRIATTIPEPHSDFKDKLMALQPGEKVHLFGPFGEFHVDKCGARVVGIAGGIGITPFRALLSSIAQQCPNTHITLIYGGKNGHHFFKDTLDALQLNTPHIHIVYATSPEEVNSALDEEICEHGNAAQYFISGSPGMIAGITKTLKQRGIKKIVNDPFKGY